MHVSTNSGRGRKKRTNFELNLVPFIDVLSTCICFLLVTAVFVNLGSFHTNQAVGSEKTQKREGSVTVSLGSQGQLRFEVKDVPGLARGQNVTTIQGWQGKPNLVRSDLWIKYFAANHKDVKTVLIMPNPSSKYDDMIQLMAQFKQASMDQIGVAPL